MSGQNYRIYNIVRGREGDMTSAMLCTGRRHVPIDDLVKAIWWHNSRIVVCDGEACQGDGSEELDVSQLSSWNQEDLGVVASVPQGMILVAWYRTSQGGAFTRCFSSGEMAAIKLLETGTLIPDGGGTTFTNEEYAGWSLSTRPYVYYVRNVGGKAIKRRVGRQDRKRTYKKLAKLRRDERKTEVSFEVSYLNERMQELMQLHRTPEVKAEIDNVKELLRLAASLYVEASIEAAEGNEEIARELANSRAREISAELVRVRERLTLEAAARSEARKELDTL